MVYNSKTLEILHPLTERGQIEYSKMLETEGDKILFRSQHPLKWLVQQVMSWFGY